MIGVPDTAVSEVGAYPGYSGALSVRATVAVQNNDYNTGIILEGTIVGLQANVTGGIHIHSGVSCANESYVGGHYYDTDWASGDPWSTTYTSDENGVATVYIEMDDFSLTGDYPVAGRTIVVHASDGTRIGCGIIESTPGEVVQLGRYPDLAQTIGYNVSGTFLVSDADSGGINITGTMGGLQASVSGGLHVHSGYTCSNDIYDDLYSVSVGGHYYDGMASDPWDTMYVSDSDGYWHNTIHVSTFTVEDAFPVAYRTLVVHMSASANATRIGCGLIYEDEIFNNQTSVLTAMPSLMPSPAPSHPPTRKPTLRPTQKPTTPSPTADANPTAVPTSLPTIVDTVSVFVELTMTASAEPTASDEATMKTTIASEIDVDELNIRNFKITYSEVGSSTTRKRQRGRRLTSYTWDVTFDVEVSKAVIEETDSISSAADFATMIEDTLSSELVSALEAEGITVTGLTVETEVLRGDDDDNSKDDKDNLSAAGLGAAIGVPIGVVALLIIAFLLRHRLGYKSGILKGNGSKKDGKGFQSFVTHATFEDMEGGAAEDSGRGFELRSSTLNPESSSPPDYINRNDLDTVNLNPLRGDDD